MKELRENIIPKSGMLSIGDLSERTGIKVVTIRYYEGLGLLPDPRSKKGSRSRLYSESYISRLVFIKKARSLGFSLSEVGEMIQWAEKRNSVVGKRSVKKIYSKMKTIDDKIRELRLLRKELFSLISG